jgi:hypothetical protein
MPSGINPGQEAENDGTMREDEPIPRASEDKVLEDTARMAREGRKELENDPREQRIEREDKSDDKP